MGQNTVVEIIILVFFHWSNYCRISAWTQASFFYLMLAAGCSLFPTPYPLWNGATCTWKMATFHKTFHHATRQTCSVLLVKTLEYYKHCIGQHFCLVLTPLEESKEVIETDQQNCLWNSDVNVYLKYVLPVAITGKQLIMCACFICLSVQWNYLNVIIGCTCATD